MNFQYCSLITSFAIAAILSGCGQSPDNASRPATAPTSTDTETGTETKIDAETDRRVAEILELYPDRFGSHEEDEEAREKRAEKLREEVVAMGSKAVPSLIKHLDNKKLRGGATEILAEFGPEARSAAPKLLEILRTDESFVSFDRLAANKALERVGGDPSVLAKSLDSENGNERIGALKAIQGMGKDIRPLLPKLMTIIKDLEEDSVIRIDTTELLTALGGDAAEMVPELIELLEETDVYSDPRIKIDNEPVVVGGVAAAASKVLGSIGPKAKAALPALKKLATDESEYNRKAAEDAIKKITGEQ